MTNSSIHTELAGLSIRMRFHDRNLRHSVLQEWQAGCVPLDVAKSGGKRIIHIEVQQDSKHSLPCKPGLFLDGYGEYSGEFDSKKRSGVVMLTGKRPANALMNYIVRVCARTVVDQGGLVLHASCVVRNSEAYVFAGPSGAGKSTICGFSPDFLILSDDLTVIRKHGRRHFVLGMPGTGGSPVAETGSFALKAVFKLVKDTKNQVLRLGDSKAVAGILALPQALRDKAVIGRTLAFLDELTDHVPCYELHFRKDSSFWKCIDKELGVGIAGKRVKRNE